MMKYHHVASAIVLAGFIGLAAGSEDSKSDGNSVTTDTVVTHPPAADTSVRTAPRTKQVYMEQVDRELASVPGFNASPYRGTKDALMLETVLFGVWAKLINEADQYPLAPSEKSRVSRLRERVSALQVREFPRMRAEYARIVGNAMWEQDMQVSTSGARHGTLRMTAAIFASNGNILKIHQIMREPAVLFRYKRVEYRWYRNADEYSYYTMEVPPDGAVREVTSQGWSGE